MSFPRARGDVPPWLLLLLWVPGFSPRTRGCSHGFRQIPRRQTVFPAHAGMFLDIRSPPPRHWCFPRARGDVPWGYSAELPNGQFSPRTRGCSAGGQEWFLGLFVFPAHAGMFLIAHGGRLVETSFPRARGDVPPCRSPPPRPAVFSPRTRGCSETGKVFKGLSTVFPAHAGMFRSKMWGKPQKQSFPRARGDVPPAWLPCWKTPGFSPRTRGCSVNPKSPASGLRVFPAHAGTHHHPWPSFFVFPAYAGMFPIAAFRNYV